MAIDLTAEELVDRGLDKSQEGDEQGAIEDFNKAIETDPNYANAFKAEVMLVMDMIWREQLNLSLPVSLPTTIGVLLSIAYLIANQQNDDFSKVIALDPSYSDAYHYRGLARFDLGDNQGAIADFTRAISFNSYKTLTYCYKIADYFYRASIRFSIGDKYGAVEDYQKAAELSLMKEESKLPKSS
ncbi:MAG: hypothetical protein HC856_10265 [Pseudanabaena sp. RU_4_16]|nr:hypothetical protein [Pseudanabaena sp. RU_4_16]